jgi:hypothetical protein
VPPVRVRGGAARGGRGGVAARVVELVAGGSVGTDADSIGGGVSASPLGSGAAAGVSSVGAVASEGGSEAVGSLAALVVTRTIAAAPTARAPSPRSAEPPRSGRLAGTEGSGGGESSLNMTSVELAGCESVRV